MEVGGHGRHRKTRVPDAQIGDSRVVGLELPRMDYRTGSCGYGGGYEAATVGMEARQREIEKAGRRRP